MRSTIEVRDLATRPTLMRRPGTGREKIVFFRADCPRTHVLFILKVLQKVVPDKIILFESFLENIKWYRVSPVQNYALDQ